MPPLESLLQNVSNRMGGQPNGGQPSPAGPLPASLQQGNTPSKVMDYVSGLLGGGNPLQQQNNAYVKGRVDQQMAVQNAAKQAAMAAAKKAGNTALNRLKKLNPPPTAPPGVNPGPTQPAVGAIPFQGNIQGQ